MNVRNLILTNFTTHARTKVAFPEKGVLLITGENGAGKSSICEGVSWGGWGKMLRDDLPWIDDAKDKVCTVQLETDKVTLARTRSGGKNSLEWEADGVDPVEYETATKAQEALTTVLGPYSLWRRSHVFSSSDAMHFTLATDGDRKKLIESFLGTSFDQALKACRDDLKKAELRQADLIRARDVAVVELRGLRDRLQQAKDERDNAPKDDVEPPTPPKGKSSADLQKLLSAAEKDIREAGDRVRELDRAAGHFEAQAQQIRRTLEEKLAGDLCPTCAQKISPESRAQHEKELKEIRARAEKERKESNAARDAADALRSELGAEIAELRRAVQARQTADAQYLKDKQRHEEALARADKAQARIAALAAKLKEARAAAELQEEDLAAWTDEVAELTEVEAVLGLQGFRAHILGQSLGGIEAVANAWLSRLHPGLLISLTPYSDKGVADSISLTIKGRGRGTYRSNSNGERRRIDIALLLALGEVAAAASGGAPGTLFFDEVMDALDDDGVQAATDALVALAEERCVVVISHNAALVQGLKPHAVKRLHVANGALVALA